MQKTKFSHLDHFSFLKTLSLTYMHTRKKKQNYIHAKNKFSILLIFLY